MMVSDPASLDHQLRYYYYQERAQLRNLLPGTSSNNSHWLHDWLVFDRIYMSGSWSILKTNIIHRR